MSQPGPVDQAVNAVSAPVRMVTGLLPGADAASSLADAATAVRRWTSDRHNWIRVSWFVSGSIVAYIGVVMLARKPLGQAAQTAGVTPSQLKTLVAGTAKTAVTKGRA